MSKAATPDVPELKAWRDLCQSVLPVWQQHLGLAQQQADQGVRSLLSSFASLNQRLRSQPGLVPPDVLEALDQILTAFQYHDRLDQMMQLLHNDMGRMGQASTLGQGPAALDRQQWLDRLESEYVMAEQHALHAHPGPSDGTDDTTYF